MNKRAEMDFGGLVLFVLFVLFASAFVIDYQFGVNCKVRSISEDKYCVDATNVTYGHVWQVRSHEQDRINSEKATQEKKKWDDEYQKKIECYANGYDYSESFDIFEDYNLTCNKIDYLNDHLMDNFEKVDGGYIKGSYSGFLSHGRVEGKSYQYINERIVATGKLIEKIEYHVDCNNSTDKYILTHTWVGTHFESKDTTKIDYFTEEEFVMAYVERCIE